MEKLKKIADFLNAEIKIYHKDIWNELKNYDAIIAVMPAGIVVRGLCGILKNKWVDPTVIVLDKRLRYAVPIIGGHHGANLIAKKLEKIGIKAVITTSMEFDEGYAVGVGYRKNVCAEKIILAIKKALKEIDADSREIRVIATWDAKKDDREIIRVAEYFKRPLMFLSAEEINRTDVKSESKAEKFGLRCVSEACALFFSNRKRLVLPKRVYGGVTVAIAW